MEAMKNKLVDRRFIIFALKVSDGIETAENKNVVITGVLSALNHYKTDTYEKRC